MKYITTLLLLITSINLSANEYTDSSVLVVSYSCNIDYLHRNKISNYKGTLLLNKYKSYYFQERNPNFQMAKVENEVVVKTNRKTQNHIVCTNFSTNEIVFSDEVYMNKYFQKYILDNININWEIFYDSSSIILNYKCFLAKTTFRGRMYHAWFTPDIKFNGGPWKFKDLPGLILKIYDSNRDLTWEVNSIDKKNILVPEEPKSTISYQDYSKATRTFLQKMIRAQESNNSVDPLCSSCSQAKFNINIIESDLLK